MFEALGPLISFYRVFIDELKRLSKRSSDLEEKKVKRRIIDIQIKLEDLIEASQNLIESLKSIMTKNQRSQVQEIEVNFRIVKRLTHNFLFILQRSTRYAEDDIFKTFTPETRRKIYLLTAQRGGIIDELMPYIDRIKCDDRDGNCYVPVLPITWSHEGFMADAEGEIQKCHIQKDDKEIRVPLAEALNRYEFILSGLVECSNALSDFISSNFKIEEVIFSSKKIK